MWLNERNAIALDENWTEPTNLQAKVLKHQSFEAEVLANRYRVETLSKVRWAEAGDPFPSPPHLTAGADVLMRECRMERSC